MNQTNIQIDPEFEQFIPPPLPEELRQLEENILRDGAILSPLILWNGILVDGHNRYRIAQKHPEISYTTIEREFPDRYAALAWICRNQLGRRNLNRKQRDYLLGKQYEAERQENGGLRNCNRNTTGRFATGCQSDNLWAANKTCDRIAKEHQVSPRSVLRAHDFSKSVDIADALSPGFKNDILTGAIRPTTKEVQAIAKADPEERPAMVEKIKQPKPKAKKFDLMQKIGDDMLETHGEAKASDMIYELEDAAESLKFRWEFALEIYEKHRKDPANIPQIDALLDDLLTFLNQVKEENAKIRNP